MKTEEIKAAHYGKVYGEIPGIARYFNPTPNDRNIEYEVLNNLFNEKGTYIIFL